MSLDVTKLEKVRELANGVRQARCPACAEGGSDKKGEHLRIYADGRYGCCVYPGDVQHRTRIFALAGSFRTGTRRGQFTIKVGATVASAEPARSILQELVGALRTFRTGDLKCGMQNAECRMAETVVGGDFRTLRTPISNPRAYAREESDPTYIYKDCEKGVLSVLVPESAERAQLRLPFLSADGTLCIPFDSPKHYHWWKGGQSVGQTLAEVRARLEVT